MAFTIINSSNPFSEKDNSSNNLNYLTIPIEEIDNISNQQNIIFKSLSDDKFCFTKNLNNSVRPSVIEFGSNDQINTNSDTPEKENIKATNENEIQIKSNTVKNVKQKKPLLQCDICSCKFKNSVYYKHHIQQHDRKKKYKCDQCFESFNVHDNFKIHMVMHGKGDPKCPLCDRKFQRLASFKSHLLIHQIEEVFTCTNCNLEFENEEELNTHLSNHLNTCKEINSTANTFSCRTCNSAFENHKDYKEHLSYHSKVNRLLSCARKNRRRKSIKKDYPHKCNICNKGFHKLSELDRHFRIHSGEKPFICTECNRGFAQKVTLQIHMIKHTGVKPFSCTLCPAKFCQKGNLRVHVEKTHKVPGPGENMFKCTLCSCSFKKISSLNGHVTKAHSGKKYDDISEVLFQLKELEKHTNGIVTEIQRKESQLGFSSKDLNLTSVQNQEKTSSEQTSNYKYVTLAESISGDNVKCYEVKQRTIGDTRWYMCSYCNKEFKKPSDLIRHLRVHTREKPYNCTICEQKFSLKSTLSTHMNTHISGKLYKCKICGRNFTAAKALYIHNRRHERGDLKNSTAQEDKVLSCDLCKVTGFQNEFEMKLHMEEHQEQFQSNESNNSFKQPLLLIPEGVVSTTESLQLKEICPSYNASAPHMCTVCYASFSKKVYLNRHILKHNNERKHKCDVCGRTFRNTYAMKLHLRYHFNVKHYCCKVCGKRFVTNSNLNRHVLTHSNRKSHICLVCKKQFKMLQLLKKHMLTHTTERFFACSYCDKKFKTVTLCKAHVKTHNEHIKNLSLDESNIPASDDNLPKENEMLLNINEQNITTQSNLVSIPTTNVDEEILSEMLFDYDKQLLVNQNGKYLPMQIEKLSSNENENENLLNNNSNPSVQTFFIDYEDIIRNQMISSDVSQTKINNEELNNITDQANILLTVDPAFNQLTNNNCEAFLTDLPSVVSTDLIAMRDSELPKSEQLLNENLNKTISPTDVTNISLSNPAINLFGSDDFIDYGIRVSPSEVIANKETENCETLLPDKINDLNVQSVNETSPSTDANSESTKQVNENENDGYFEKGINYLKSNKKSSLSYQCPHCYKVFNKKNTFIKHQNYHKKRDQKDNDCKYCFKHFKKPSDLVRHLRTHTGERPYHCSYCDKGFSLKSTLDSHHKTHQPGGNKEFNCAVCNSYFSSKSSLKVHMLLHTGAKPYSCPCCLMKFRTTGQRQLHVKKHEKDLQNFETKNTFENENDTEISNCENLDSEQNDFIPMNEGEQMMVANIVNNIANVEENVPLQENVGISTTIEIDPLFYHLGIERDNYNQENAGTLPVSFIQLDDNNLLTIRVDPTNQTLDVSDLLLTDSVENIVSQPTFDEIKNALNQESVEDFNVLDSRVTCDICKKTLKNQKILKRHLKIHEKKKIFCDNCSKTFYSEHELTKHKLLHISDIT